MAPLVIQTYPLLVEGGEVNYPGDRERPGSEANRNVLADTRKALGSFKVETLIAEIDLTKQEVSIDVQNGYMDSSPAPMLPMGGKMFYAAAVCSRKYDEKHADKLIPHSATPTGSNQGKKIKSSKTGRAYDM